jgi:hypothetical protein
LSYLVLAPIGILFLIGLWVKAGSNSQLAAFIENPEHPSFSSKLKHHLKTIFQRVFFQYFQLCSLEMESLTSSSGKLLISGWWGWLRHPNFLGDIIMHWAFVLPCGNSNVFQYFYVFPIIFCKFPSRWYVPTLCGGDICHCLFCLPNKRKRLGWKTEVWTILGSILSTRAVSCNSTSILRRQQIFLD